MQVLVGGPLDGKAIQDSDLKVLQCANHFKAPFQKLSADWHVAHPVAGTVERYIRESIIVGDIEILYRHHESTSPEDSIIKLFQWYSGKRKLSETLSPTYINRIVGKDFAEEIHTWEIPRAY